MTEHEKATRQLGLFLSGALSPREESLLRAHLRDCSDCSKRLEHQRRVVGAIEELPEESPPPALVARIITQAQERRGQVLRDRRLARQVLELAVLGWTLVLISVPVWQVVLNRVREWLAVPGEAGPIEALLAGAVLTYLFLPGLLPLLAARRPVSDPYCSQPPN